VDNHIQNWIAKLGRIAEKFKKRLSTVNDKKGWCICTTALMCTKMQHYLWLNYFLRKLLIKKNTLRITPVTIK